MPTRILIVGVAHIVLSLIVNKKKHILKEPVKSVEISYIMFVEVT